MVVQCVHNIQDQCCHDTRNATLIPVLITRGRVLHRSVGWQGFTSTISWWRHESRSQYASALCNNLLGKTSVTTQHFIPVKPFSPRQEPVQLIGAAHVLVTLFLCDQTNQTKGGKKQELIIVLRKLKTMKWCFHIWRWHVYSWLCVPIGL